jgi:type IV pilus assembly protein PilC
MARYSYFAKSLTGETREGVLEAKDEHELAKNLRQEGYILIKADLERKKSLTKKDLLEIFGRFWKIPLREKIFFTRNLKIMIGAGVSLPRAIRTLANQSKNKKFQQVLFKIEEDVTRGKNLSEALSKHSQVFPEVFRSMIKVGEESGTLEDVLENLTSQMEREGDLKSKIKGAMIYPAVILSVMVLIGVLMMIMVVPKLAAVFEDLKAELPFTTKIIIGLSQSLERFWPFLFLIIILVVILSRLIPKSKRIKKSLDMLFLKLPIISPLIKKINTASTSRTLSALIASGVPIVRSLEIVAGTLNNFYFREALQKATDEVQKGGKLSQILGKYQNLFPSIMIQMIAVGEETGETSQILAKLAAFYEEEVSNVTKNLSSIIEPLLMVVIGAAVGFFAISMVQPMYSMMGAM